MNNYQERQNAKANKLTQQANKARAEGTAQTEQARTFFHNLNGQPMLPGHHSYQADKNRRAKNRNKMDQGFKNLDKANELDRRAAAVGSAGIASDDPKAITRLQHKLDYIDNERNLIKTINRITRKHAPKLLPGHNYNPETLQADLTKAGIPTDLIRAALQPDFTGRIGIETWQLDNRTAEARRLTKRINELQDMHQAAHNNPAEWNGNGWTMWADHDQGRIYCEIDGRLTHTSFTAIRSAGGFNWSRRDSRYTRKITPNALKAAAALADRLDQLIEVEQ